MSETALPVTWLSAEGVVRGASTPPIQLALCDLTITSAVVTPDGKLAICIVESLDGEPDARAMAYSLRDGAETWPAAVCGDQIVGVAGPVVWIADSSELTLTAHRISDGVAVSTLPHDGGVFAVVKEHVLCQSDTHVTLYASGLLWQVAADEKLWAQEVRVARGDWFCLAGRNGTCHLYSLRDGSPVASVLDKRPKSLADVLVIYDPTRVLSVESHVPANVFALRERLIVETLQTDTTISKVSGECYTTMGCVVSVLPPLSARSAAVEVIVYRHECIRVVQSETVRVLDTRPARGIVAAWHWTPLQYARRESEEIGKAVAAVDAADAAADTNTVGLVRAVLVAFVAEDAHLTLLRLAA